MTATNYKGDPRNPKDLRKLPIDTVIQLYAMAKDPEYIHGTGCSCHTNPGQKDRCPTGKVMYKKIAKAIGIEKTTAHSYLDEYYREERNEKIREYKKTERGKAAQKRYQQSEKGRANQRRCQQSEKTKKAQRKYRQSPEGKAKRKEYKKDYRQSEKGKQARARQMQRYKMKHYLKCNTGFRALGYLLRELDIL